ncbi:MAG: adenylate/guanylate cyclase domain-containing protein [Actinomycetota bacterium]
MNEADGRTTEATFLFADLSGFTALTEAHGDLDAAQIAKRFSALTKNALAGDARLVKTIGDEVMIVASTPREGASTALALARAVKAESLFPAVRAGLHHGPAVEQDSDFFGAAVNLAARVAGHARSGQILCTDTVASNIPGSGIETIAAGLGHFKNISEPVRLFEIVDPQHRDGASDVDPVCQMRIASGTAQGQLVYAGRTWLFCSFDCARTFAERPDTYTGG